MLPLRTAVIGTGHLGRIHARLAAEAPHIDLVAIVDVNQEARERVAEETGCRAVADYREVLGEIEAAIVATPTIYHHHVVKDLLGSGIHVLVEKPITTTVEEADELVELAKTNGLKLQVGHVERFNPGLDCVADDLADIRFIQGIRASGFTFRSTDIGVVMDLMIHDIDIVLSLVKSRVVHVDAFGVAVMGDSEDIAQAQLRFANGAIAQLTASRVNYQGARSMQVFTPTGFTDIDFAGRSATTVRPTAELLTRQFDLNSLTTDQVAHYRDHLFEELLVKKQHEPSQTNAIAEEHRDFAEAIRTGRDVRVTGQAGRNALAVAEQVLEAIDKHLWDASPLGRRGAQLTPAVPLRKAG
ncbi:Gfo/Idh/MocA family oxidoreductase [Aeoliella sp. ICT_H6.2]|uniref:Gfo/Idh/MocA family oxidoreductase n=1 Tax=Aeoliella straminimaris TaxID=2954799 RepID=A0A9X2F9P6_9BACT|nr:Gfo/Idh/MocA family oxidoreductase [Aeoliella straminimaris]MCO6044484.1 Gfo/Idh/MocA family oxidoreductase [Aeoliella straminimaris]